MPITTSLGVPSRIERDPAQWSREFTDPEVLKAEQEKLGARCWTFLGLTRDLQNDGDWIRADLWGRSVFVQRFRDRLAGFENVCAHRFFPLKTEDKGNGALRCGLHGWMYNAEGEVIGAPMCEELFGKKASELKRPLKSIEIDTCGGLVFGRMPALTGDNTPRQTLAEYLGPTKSILRRMTENTTPIGTLEGVEVAANWKLCYHLTLEDYHIGVAHPKTFSASGFIKYGTYRYFFPYPHSAMFTHEDVEERSFVYFQAECAQGRLPRHGYRVFQIFPNLLIALHWEGTVYIGLYSGVSPGKTAHRAWALQVREPEEELFTEQKKIEIMNFTTLTAEEDALSAECLQQAASQIWLKPLLSGQEQRIAAFDDVYNKYMADEN